MPAVSVGTGESAVSSPLNLSAAMSPRDVSSLFESAFSFSSLATCVFPEFFLAECCLLHKDPSVETVSVALAPTVSLTDC
jgi:hypothetical protein